MNNIVAIVTLYHPDDSVPERMKAIAEQVTWLILSDNTPNKDNSSLFKDIKNVVYLCNKKNLGLSGAINCGLRTRRARESDYLFFFDQDSQVESGHIDTMIKDWNELEKNHRIGLLGPFYYDEITQSYNVDSFVTGVNTENEYKPVRQMITSSMMSRYSVLKEIKFWNRKIFLDYADYDLCWRLLGKGYELFLTSNVCMNHRIGIGSVPAFDLITRKHFRLAYGAPIRRYYQTRASIKLLRWGYVPKEWRKWLIANLTLRCYFELVYLPDKLKLTKYYLLGLMDGFLNINGEFKKILHSMENNNEKQ